MTSHGLFQKSETQRHEKEEKKGTADGQRYCGVYDKIRDITVNSVTLDYQVRFYGLDISRYSKNS